jgi:hypothetical protein
MSAAQNGAAEGPGDSDKRQALYGALEPARHQQLYACMHAMPDALVVSSMPIYLISCTLKQKCQCPGQGDLTALWWAPVLAGLGARMKYLVDTPEVIWGCLDSRQWLAAAQRLLRASQARRCRSAQDIVYLGCLFMSPTSFGLALPRVKSERRVLAEGRYHCFWCTACRCMRA